MRLLFAFASIAAVALVAPGPARAIDVEVLPAPAGTSAAPSADSGNPAGGGVETGSIGKEAAQSESIEETGSAPKATLTTEPDPGSDTGADASDAPPVLPPEGSADGDAGSGAKVEDAATPRETGTGSALAQAIRKLIEDEAVAVKAAAESAPPLPEGAKRPPKTAAERDREAMAAFYGSRGFEPVWIAEGKLAPKAFAVAAEALRLGDWGLDASAIELPQLVMSEASSTTASDAELAAAELVMARAVLNYHLLARGGAIYDAPREVSSYLDRRPSLRDRKTVLTDIAEAPDAAGYLVDMHPQHAEFKRLHQAWREARKGKTKAKVTADQLLANMQQWRWLPEELGSFHVWVNVPEATIQVYKEGAVVFDERITIGLINKQTPIFSDEIERVTFKSRWRVPDSIKVKEVWPSLLHGGGMMRQFGLVMMKGEEEVDWRAIDWSKADMNDYTLWQPPGPKNQLGLVKFSFPSKHRVYMHDTPDKHMFAWSRRAVSHGCMRVRNPLQMAAVILGNDKGWDRAKIDDLVRNGADHNIVELDRKVPVHMAYLTVRIGEDGRIRTVPDVYGHEKRVRQALAGRWKEIARGADHLAPLDQTRVPIVVSSSRKSRALREPRTLTELMFGGN